MPFGNHIIHYIRTSLASQFLGVCKEDKFLIPCMKYNYRRVAPGHIVKYIIILTLGEYLSRFCVPFQLVSENSLSSSLFRVSKVWKIYNIATFEFCVTPGHYLFIMLGMPNQYFDSYCLSFLYIFSQQLVQFSPFFTLQPPLFHSTA